MSDFIEDIERQYETYCEIAEEYGFLDVSAKKSGFRCTTKSSEFNAGWISFTGAISAMRDDQQSKINELQNQLKSIVSEFDLWGGASDQVERQIEIIKELIK